jgi:curved DNA-binding protein CbpA
MSDRSDLPSPKDFQLLGVESDAPQDLVKKAYKAFVKTWHPDRFPQGSRQQHHAEEKLKNINAAYRRIRNLWAANIPENNPENARAEEPKVYQQGASRTREATADSSTTSESLARASSAKLRAKEEGFSRCDAGSVTALNPCRGD